MFEDFASATPESKASEVASKKKSSEMNYIHIFLPEDILALDMASQELLSAGEWRLPNYFEVAPLYLF